ncbi:MAG: DUF503 domain-containing protein [Verrucomicrobia bacterium]|nr:DUF503 domain-containing protein [Verrucomicrobiota bacterium]
MVIGLLELELRIPEAQSLKDKRAVVRSLRDRIRNRFNVSVAEVDGGDAHQHGLLGVAHVSNEQKFSNQVLSQIVNLVENERNVELVDYRLSFL